MSENKEKFTYTYTAPTENERREINDIRRRYLPKSEYETKLGQLKAADVRVRQIPLVAGIALGVVGTHAFGLGLTFVLEWNNILTGALIALAGVILIALAYPVYGVLFKRNKKKHGEEILKLSSELLGDSDKPNEADR